MVYHLLINLSFFYQSKSRGVLAVPTPSTQSSGTTTPVSFDSMAGSSPWVTTVTRGPQQIPQSLTPTSSGPPLKRLPTVTTTSAISTANQEVHSTAGVLESLLMGGYVAPDSRIRRVSGPATTTASARQRNPSEATPAVVGCGGYERRQILSNSGPSSACCQRGKIGGSSNFVFDSEEWPTVTSSGSVYGGNSGSSPPLTGARGGTLNSASQHIVVSGFVSK